MHWNSPARRPYCAAVSKLEQVQAHAAKLRQIAASFGANRLAVFGSVARGEERPDSDVDLIMQFPSLDKWADIDVMRAEFARCLGCAVDVADWSGIKDRDGHITGEAIYL